MFKKYKRTLIITSILTLLPMLFAVFAGDLLPEEIAIHYGINGEADGFASPGLFFILMPALLLVIHWFCAVITLVVDKENEQNKKVLGIMFWIAPVISLGVSGSVIFTAAGYSFSAYSVVMIVLAVVLMVIGNYLPKTTRNRTVGIKVIWALSNDENWNATHRFAGKTSFFGGILCLFGIFLPEKLAPLTFIVIILAVGILPTIYSYCFYKKQLKEGSATSEDYKKNRITIVKNKKLATIITIVMTAALTVFFTFIMFTGDVNATLGENGVRINASFWSDISIDYDSIDSIEYREAGVDGTRVSGFGSARLLLGAFRNEEFGNYTRYTYTGNHPCIVLKTDGRVVVFGANDNETTARIYNELSGKLG